jgi:hypothetical protein
MPVDPSLITDTLSRWQSPQFAFPDPLAQYAKVQALKNGILQQQSDALDIQQKQQQIAGQKALDDAMTNAYTRNADGTLELNVDAVTNGLTQKGFGHLVPGVLKNAADMQESAAKAKTAVLAAKNATNDYTASALATIHDSGYDPHVAIGALAHAVDNGIVPAQQAAALTAQIQQNPTPDGVKQVLAPIFAASPGFQERITKAQTAQAAADRAKAAGTEADVATAKEQTARDQQFLNSVAGVQSQQELDQLRGQAAAQKVSPSAVARTPAAYSPDAMQALGRSLMTAEQRTQADQAALNERNTEADRKVTQAQNARRIAIEGQNAGINAQKFAMEYGGDAVKGWAKQIADNPDTANQVPPALRTAVMQRFTSDTGLPYPKPLQGTAVDTERASRNALDAVQQIKDALADPEIQSRVGPILGRLGNAEQGVGTAVGLSPAAEAKAQQLRTNMRYLVFQEGKALMGGRIPQNLMQQLEQSSPSVKMDAGTLNGALAGVTDAANRNLDQTFKQRFGDTAARPGSAANPRAPAALPNGGGKPIDKATAQQFYKAAGGDPKKARALAQQNNWAVPAQ